MPHLTQSLQAVLKTPSRKGLGLPGSAAAALDEDGFGLKRPGRKAE